MSSYKFVMKLATCIKHKTTATGLNYRADTDGKQQFETHKYTHFSH